MIVCCYELILSFFVIIWPIRVLPGTPNILKRVFMGTFATQSVSLLLYSVLTKSRKIRKKIKNCQKIWVILPVGTCRYFRILTGTFSKKIQVLLDTYGPLKQSENGNIWSRGGGGKLTENVILRNIV